MSSPTRTPIYWSFSGPDSWRLSVPQESSSFVGHPDLIDELEKRSPGRNLSHCDAQENLPSSRSIYVTLQWILEARQNPQVR
jgi:hypothetical protein